MAVGAFGFHDVAPVFFKKKRHLHAVRGDDGIVIRLERFTDNRFHTVEPHSAWVGCDQPALGPEPPPVPELITKAAHAGVIVAETNRPEKIRTGKDDLPAGPHHANDFSNKRFRFLNMLQHVQCTHTVECGIVEGQVAAIIESATIADLLGLGDVGFRNLYSVCLVPGVDQPLYDLPNAAANVQHFAVGPSRA